MSDKDRPLDQSEARTAWAVFHSKYQVHTEYLNGSAYTIHSTIKFSTSSDVDCEFINIHLTFYTNLVITRMIFEKHCKYMFYWNKLLYILYFSSVSRIRRMSNVDLGEIAWLSDFCRNTCNCVIKTWLLIVEHTAVQTFPVHPFLLSPWQPLHRPHLVLQPMHLGYVVRNRTRRSHFTCHTVVSLAPCQV